MKKISTLYAIYMITVIPCNCTIFVGTFSDVYMNRNDLGHFMSNIRAPIAFTNILWIFFYFR